jgi:hypothetical protein
MRRARNPGDFNLNKLFLIKMQTNIRHPEIFFLHAGSRDFTINCF